MKHTMDYTENKREIVYAKYDIIWSLQMPNSLSEDGLQVGNTVQ